MIIEDPLQFGFLLEWNIESWSDDMMKRGSMRLTILSL